MWFSCPTSTIQGFFGDYWAYWDVHAPTSFKFRRGIERFDPFCRFVAVNVIIPFLFNSICFLSNNNNNDGSNITCVQVCNWNSSSTCTTVKQTHEKKTCWLINSSHSSNPLSPPTIRYFECVSNGSQWVVSSKFTGLMPFRYYPLVAIENSHL